MITTILVILIIAFCLGVISALGTRNGWAEALTTAVTLAGLIGLLVLRKLGLV